jgi:hypothetical protein
MVERKRLMLDANILIRACLDIRVRDLIAAYASEVDFFVAEANGAEAELPQRVSAPSRHQSAGLPGRL